MNVTDGKNENRVGIWIINCCIITAMVFAWAAGKWVWISPYAIAAIVIATVVSLSVLCIAKYTERKVAASKAKSTDTTIPALSDWILTTLTKNTPTPAPHLESINMAAAYEAYQKKIFAIYSEHAALDDVVAARWISSTKYYRQQRTHRQAISSRSYNLDPQSERYSVTIGSVQIEINGNDTRIVVRDNKNVSIETSGIKSELTRQTANMTGEDRKMFN